MNAEKYDNIKKEFCVEVTQVNLNAMTNEAPQLINGENLTYNYNNGVVSFIDENGICYVTPFYEIINTLKQAGYNKAGLYVPFSDNKWLNEGTHSWKWKNLVAQDLKNRNENIDLNENFNIEENIENNMSL